MRYIESLYYINTNMDTIYTMVPLLLTVTLVLGDTGSLPRGHLEPFGSHRPAEGSIEHLDTLPSPEEFFYKYSQPGKPVLMKGAARKLPNFENLTDEYFRSKYGQLKMEVEPMKKEDRNQQPLVIPFEQFLDEYKIEEYYMSQDVKDEMRDEFYLLKPLLCGGYTTALYQAIMWFSAGGTTSSLHSDAFDNINCLFDGSKDFIMVDKVHKELVESDGWIQAETYSGADVDSVDLETFPGLGKVPWWSAKMERGDCIYIPFKWYHQVRSYGTRNLAQSIWYANLAEHFSSKECEVVGDIPDFMPLSSFKVKDASGVFRSTLLREFEELGKVTRKEMGEILGAYNVKVAPESLDEVFEMLDTNLDKRLSWEEIYNCDWNLILRTVPEINSFVQNLENTSEHDEL